MTIEEIVEAAPGTLQAALQRARSVAARASQERHQAERAYELAYVRLEQARNAEAVARDGLETAKQAIADAELRVPLSNAEVLGVLADAGDGVAHGVVGVLRRAIRLTAQVRQAAHGFKNTSETGLARIRSGLTEAGQTQHDQARVVRQQGRHVQPPLIERTGAKVLDQHIKISDQL
mgnify:CR=1 FL=1